MSAPEANRAKKLTLSGAVLAAIAASSCCIGPLVLAALGIGGAGALAALGAYRPYILGVTAVLLAVGFYLTYRGPRAAEGDACGCEQPAKTGRAGRFGLWMATALVVVFAAAPSILVRVANREHAAAAAPGAQLQHATIRVDGMDCEACSVNIEAEVAKVGGLHGMKVDVSAHAVDVTYEPAAGRLQAYVAAINALGYEAALPRETSASSR